jgi:RNA polymerase sigma factor (sigma-70 family)
LEVQVAQAQLGNRASLEAVVAAVQRPIYALALRMLWHPQDAEDATQEILIRIITRIGGFRGESGFMTWCYRVATNHLSDVRRGRMEGMLDFTRFGADLDEGLAEPASVLPDSADHALLLEEVKIGCTLGMLLCLDRGHRLAYILGEILDLDQAEAAAILGIGGAAFRKRLSRARRDIVAFTQSKCGLVQPDNPCRCRKRVGAAVAKGRVNPSLLLHASDAEAARRFPDVLREIRNLEELQRTVALYRSHPEPRMPADFTTLVQSVLVPIPDSSPD